jgi:hypothetical protein
LNPENAATVIPEGKTEDKTLNRNPKPPLNPSKRAESSGFTGFRSRYTLNP